jgi:AcrR family transcriptional regulator
MDTARNVQKRQSEIVDAAAKVFAEKGFHGASTQDIADVLSIRQASLYYYFRSKDEALRLVCERGASEFLERARRVSDGSGTSREKLVALIRGHLEPLASAPHYMRVFLRERQHLSPADRRAISKTARAIEACFETVIAEGIAYGSFSPSHDARLATLAILGMLNGAPFWHERRQRKPEDIAKGLAQIALGGLTGIQWHDI